LQNQQESRFLFREVKVNNYSLIYLYLSFWICLRYFISLFFLWLLPSRDLWHCTRLIDANIPVLNWPAIWLGSGIKRGALWDTGVRSLLSGGGHIGESSLAMSKDRLESGNSRRPPCRGVFGWWWNPFYGQIIWECRENSRATGCVESVKGWRNGNERVEDGLRDRGDGMFGFDSRGRRLDNVG